MDIINEFINYIARTNLFNFVIFLTIIICVCIKLNVKQKFDDAKNEIVSVIKNSENDKLKSEEKLHEIEEGFSHIQGEIDVILTKSSENADLIGTKIIEDAKKAAVIIDDNANRTIENEQNVLKNELIKRASLASVEIAKSHIINELKNNSELHDKLINDSLDAIQGVDIQ